MIDTKDVITLRVPFPTILSELALKAHMYVCIQKTAEMKQLVKCQTYKISMILGENPLATNWIKEFPNIQRNPFTKITLIDLDKKFCTQAVLPTSLLASSRRDVCDELYSDIMKRIGECTALNITNDELRFINPRVP